MKIDDVLTLDTTGLPPLTSPVLVVGLTGWFDVAGAATSALAQLGRDSVVVGGIDRLWTATLGGFAIGFASGVINGALPTDKTVYYPSLVFALVIVALLVKPEGLFTRGQSSAVDRV